MRNLVLILGCAFLLALSGCTSSETDLEKVPNLSADKLYQMAQSHMATGDFSQARNYLEAIDSRYPFGELTDQIQLDLIYVYYKLRDPAMTSAAVNRYRRLNPTGAYTDYVTYMEGLNEIQQHGNIVQDFLRLDRARKDPTHYYTAMQILRGLIETFPNSPYVHDARQRMLFIRNQLAARELAVARYYFDRQAYLSCARHCQSLLYSFRETPYLQAALELLADCYGKLRLPLPEHNARAVLAASFGQ